MSAPHFRTASALEALTGRRLPGGCDDCDAYQVMSRLADGLYVLAVHHDETCPQLNGTTTPTKGTRK